jgi:hypothetical protein
MHYRYYKKEPDYRRGFQRLTQTVQPPPHNPSLICAHRIHKYTRRVFYSVNLFWGDYPGTILGSQTRAPEHKKGESHTGHNHKRTNQGRNLVQAASRGILIHGFSSETGGIHGIHQLGNLVDGFLVPAVAGQNLPDLIPGQAFSPLAPPGQDA